MRIRHLIPFTLLVACAGAEDPEIVHEKDGASASALLAGWSVEPMQVASVHPLANDLEQTMEVRAPDTARKFRLRFARISMERNYDFLVIQDEFGNELERITGRHINYVSRTIRGTVARIVLETDYSVASWGFELDEIRHRGCTRNPPGDLRLAPVASCADLEAEIRNLAIAEVRRRFTNNHFGGPIRTLGAPEANQRGGDAAPSHSETNVQVAGVDEADIVKTDGNFIYTVAGRQLRIFRSWPAANTTLEHSVDIEGWPKELFLHNGRVVVLSGVRGDDFVMPPVLPFVRIAPIWWNPEAFTKVTVIDPSTATPTVVSETLLAGVYNTARRVGSSVRLHLRRQLSWPQIQYYPDGNLAWDSPEFEAALEQLEADAIQTVTNRALADWLPQSYRIVNGQRVALPIQCENFLAPTGSDEIGLMAIATVDLAPAQPTVHETSALVQGAQLYQSLDNLYVTTDHRWSCWEDAGTQGSYTYLHKFDVRDPSRATYRASGGVVGSVLNQFSLDEHNGYLRVATTNNRWQEPVIADRSASFVYVLGQSGNALDIVGQVGPLAPGERIFGARFMEDRGFVVTFRQVDPLFTLDLSNPRNPTVLGELKIPGFSTYLHPLDAGHLLTIGNDFETDGTTRNGVALSIFDVRDMRNPRLIHKSVIGTPRSGSEALYNHRAFTMYTPPGDTTPILAIPFTDYDPNPNTDPSTYWSRFESSLKLFRVSAGGIMAIGNVELAPLYQSNDHNEFGWWYQPNVRRGVFVDRYAYAVSDAGMRVVQIDDPSTVVSEVLAPPQYEQPTPPAEVLTEVLTATPNRDIPDNDETGITSTLELENDMTITTLTVDVDITHTYRGDLRVTLEKDGIVEVLHDRTGGSNDDVSRTFTTERFRGEQANGAWTLRVSDHAGWDVGTLASWTINATGNPTSGGGGTPVTIERTYEVRPSIAIPDADSQGVRTEIEVPEGIRIDTLELTLDITHTYRGDLEVTLSHDGIDHVVHDRAGGSVDDVRLVVDLDAFDGRDARGTWTLTVVDHARADTGTIDTFGLRIAGEQLGR